MCIPLSSILFFVIGRILSGPTTKKPGLFFAAFLTISIVLCSSHLHTTTISFLCNKTRKYQVTIKEFNLTNLCDAYDKDYGRKGLFFLGGGVGAKAVSIFFSIRFEKLIFSGLNTKKGGNPFLNKLVYTEEYETLP